MTICEFNSDPCQRIRLSLEKLGRKRLLIIRLLENHGEGFKSSWQMISLNADKVTELKKAVDKALGYIIFEDNKNNKLEEVP